MKYDSCASTFKFGYYFNPEVQELVDLACIGHYHLAEIEHEGELLLNGYILTESFKSSSKRELSGFSGYSLSGVLQDCQIPPSIYPLQSDGLTLNEITRKLLDPFGVSYEVDSLVSSEMNKVYDTTTAEATQTIHGYLSELASQRNIVVSHTTEGKLFFTRAKTKQKAIAQINQGDGNIPVTNMSLIFSGQQMHSEITVLKQADEDGGNAGQATVTNPFVPYVFRPKVVIQNSGTDIDTELAAKTALASELKGLMLSIEMDTWTINNEVIKPNNIIEVKNPNIYLFKSTRWFIETVTLSGTPEAQKAVLSCFLPSVYDGSTPEYIFTDINTH